MHNKWLIAVACCWINALILGTGRLSPLLFVACLERYGADRGITSFPFILCYLLRTLSGPLTGYLGAKFGSKSVTIAGCFMAAFGVSACFFAEDILAINLLFGVVYGLGLGIGSSLLPAILSLHFHENLTMASGISYVGSSIGGAILPPVVSVLLNTYGVSGTLLIVGAIVLNTIPCAMLLGNPVASTQKNLEKEDSPSKTNDTTKLVQDNPDSSSVADTIVINGSSDQHLEPTSKLEGITNKAYETNSEDALSSNNFGLLRVKRRTSSVLDETPETPVLVSYTTGDSALTTSKFDRRPSRIPSSVFEITMATPVYLQYDSSKRVSVLHVGKSILTKLENPSEAEESGLGSLRIFYDPVFLVICFIQSAFCFYITVVWTVLIDYVRDKGIEQDKEIFFLVFPPIVDMFGRLFMGFVVDLGFMSETSFCSLGFLLLSLTCCMMVWSTTFGLMLFTTLTNAFVSGSAMITFPGMIVSFIDPKHRTMAMASRLIMYAPMGCAVSPSIVFFRDTLGSYNGFMYVLGFFNGVCFLLTYFIPHLARRRDTKKKLKEKGLNP
ncbi:hypothetical protein JTE90_018357 [Oedothorax gibbosus]|uniref:Monocarboxylate transporter n=1 Tax=Oedothorax gibbosus TaxID=931172 RepID=A0AAV6U076_9ARAC|nr:hypothetical protein JTE90_018357 [Oedothorax gibbosus]